MSRSPEAQAAMPASPRSVRVAPGVRWAVETNSILISDGRTELVRIDYPEAALWDFVSRRRRADRCVPLMAYIAGLDAVSAERLINDTLDAWERAGFVVGAGRDG